MKNNVRLLLHYSELYTNVFFLFFLLLYFHYYKVVFKYWCVGLVERQLSDV